MNKNIIRIASFLILVSPWIYIGSAFKDVVYIALAVVILLCTVDITKKKKQGDRDDISD